MQKHAPMGSATCFTVLPTVVYVLVVCKLLTKGVDYDEAFSSVYVYGDDIIVSTKFAQYAIESLEEHGLRLNLDKCFINSQFAESCGHDYVNGHLVTPVRLRNVNFSTKPATLNHTRDGALKWNDEYISRIGTPNSGLKNMERSMTLTTGKGIYPKTSLVKTNPALLVSLLGTANQLSAKGLTRTSERIFQFLECWLGTLPLGSQVSPYLCRWAPESIYDSIPEATALNYPETNMRSKYSHATQRADSQFKVWKTSTLDSSEQWTVAGHLLRTHKMWGTGSEVPLPGEHTLRNKIELDRYWVSEEDMGIYPASRWTP